MGVLKLPGRKTCTCLTLPPLALNSPRSPGLDELGLEVVGQRLDRDRAVLACRAPEL
jgi:hypothetical protein